MFEIKFANVEQINIVLQALAKLPYEMSAGVIETVRNQAEAQYVAIQQDIQQQTVTVDVVEDAADSVN
jgi:hypothetical protein